MVQEVYKMNYFFKDPEAAFENCHLSIFFSDYFFQYAIFSKEYNTVLELGDFTFSTNKNFDVNNFDLISMVVQNQFLPEKKFQKVILTFLNQNFTLIPPAFEPEQGDSTFLEFVNGTIAQQKIVHSKNNNLKINYAINNDYLDYFGKLYPQAIINHAASVATNLVFEQNSVVNSDVVLILHVHHFELVAKNKNQLNFYNVFKYESNEDVLYYLMHAVEQFNLDPKHLKLSIAAELAVTDNLFLLLKKYIAHVEFTVMDKSIQLKNEQQNIPMHFYFTLLNQHLCA